ncbi:putative Se/S carrier-like protein [Clostridium sp.]|uniref:putative Se/S carrier-like protein n=1 Tax=Clostridium sp. TaxID=1506 RepID=UPI003463EF4B
MQYIGVFFTHSGAIKYHRYLNSLEITNETIPVPRKLSSNCVIGVKFITDRDINNMIIEDIEKIFKIEGNESILVYECE